METISLLFRVLDALHKTIMFHIVAADDLAHEPLSRDPTPLVRSLSFNLGGGGISALSPAGEPPPWRHPLPFS